jgi:hypothetical protein
VVELSWLRAFPISADLSSNGAGGGDAAFTAVAASGPVGSSSSLSPSRSLFRAAKIKIYQR